MPRAPDTMTPVYRPAAAGSRLPRNKEP
jgi:hypothetical protein